MIALRYRFGSVVAFLLCLPIIVWWFWCSSRPTTVMIVRHADRVTSQDVLSPAGVARAQELAHVAMKANIAAIYHSDTNRARQTAQPVATALTITPIELPASDVTALINGIFSRHEGSTVLVIGHSNTVPLIVAATGGPTISDIAENEFDNLFMLTLCRCRWNRATLVNLQ